MKKNRNEIIEYINSLKGYCGYVQFSDEKIRECDIFKEYQDIKVQETKGFIYEAHFFNGIDSISIKQINDSWIVSESKNIPLTDTQTYIAKDNLKVIMAQIWEEKEDPFCEGMKVNKLSKVVFAGFDDLKQKKRPKIKKGKYTQEEKEILIDHFTAIFKDDYIDKILGESK